MRVADAQALAEGTVSTGFSLRAEADEIAPLIGELLALGGMFDRHGCGALALARTASGRLTGDLEPHMNNMFSPAYCWCARPAG
jgi:fructose-1,6-bisphosphatase/inositol monophosphatase family enzyme